MPYTQMAGGHGKKKKAYVGRNGLPWFDTQVLLFGRDPENLARHVLLFNLEAFGSFLVGI